MASRDATGTSAPRPFVLAVRRIWMLALLVLFVALPLAWLVRRSLAGWGTVPLPYDLMTFLKAGDDVVAGRSPFPSPNALTGDTNYVYPPLLAIAVIPLAVIPTAPAVLIWTIASAAALAGALWLLGVRDWRVYGLTVVVAGARDSITLGSVGPLLALGAAMAWRWRDARPAAAAAGAGLATALKLFVWLLLPWLAVTGRVRAALLAVGIGVGAALTSWAIIGFDGLADYPDILRRLSDLEAAESYSTYAVGRAIGLASPFAVVLCVATGALLLLLMFRFARDPSFDPRERDRLTLTAAVGASLALTPILWVQYLILLIVPLAIARPRLSPLWLVAVVPVVASRVFDVSTEGWPSGDPASLAVVVGTTGLLVAAMLRPTPRHAASLEEAARPTA